MSQQESDWDRIRGAIVQRLPDTLGGFVYPKSSRDLAERENAAAFDGFTILGTNAEPALPALSNLLFQGRSHLQLTWAIANIGPMGMALLTNTLTWTNAEVRNSAALALGLKYQQAKSAVPVLVDCVERGNASYDVLGALGRIGCDDPRLVPALMRLLEDKDAQANFKVDKAMAFLLLGLQHEKARVAAPLIVTEYRLLISDATAAANRRFYRRILRAIAPELETQLPPRRPDEESDGWP
jgi:HEAT repeat protein